MSATVTHRLARPRHGRMIGGVCAGLARRYGLSPSTVRVIRAEPVSASAARSRAVGSLRAICFLYPARRAPIESVALILSRRRRIEAWELPSADVASAAT